MLNVLGTYKGSYAVQLENAQIVMYCIEDVMRNILELYNLRDGMIINASTTESCTRDKFATYTHRETKLAISKRFSGTDFTVSEDNINFITLGKPETQRIMTSDFIFIPESDFCTIYSNSLMYKTKQTLHDRVLSVGMLNGEVTVVRDYLENDVILNKLRDFNGIPCSQKEAMRKVVFV